MIPTQTISLDGEWILSHDAENIGRDQQWWNGPQPNSKPIQVPWIVQEAFPDCHGVFWYWREFTAPENLHAEGRYLLRFWAVDYLADVWVNGVHVGSHEGPETPFILDVTNAIKPLETNIVTVRVLNPCADRIDGIILAEIPHRNKSVPFNSGNSFDFGGITESVELLSVPAVRIEDLYVIADPKTGILNIEATVLNAGTSYRETDIDFSVAPAAGGETIASTQVHQTLPLGQSIINSQIRIESPHLWELDSPYLYRVTAGASTDSGNGRISLDEHSVRSGFREFRVENGFFCLNGKRIFLRSTHTANHCPGGQLISPKGPRDLILQDLLFSKTLGLNMVRFIAGACHPYALDFCDEIGLMVYEEPMASWQLGDSPEVSRRFNSSTSEMIVRDRNHPSITIWGLLNETLDNPAFQCAKAALPLVRSLDENRLVLLSSGRWDTDPTVGSVSNPGSTSWDHVWGIESPTAPKQAADPTIGGYITLAGDAHIYPKVPQTRAINDFIRNMGKDTKPVFISEYGIGSVMNTIRELRKCEEAGLNPKAEDVAYLRMLTERYIADWNRLGFDDTYAFPEDMLRDSQSLMARWRTLTFDLIRANPQICGYNITGMLDHGITGEGLWTYWRELKPGIADSMMDGLAPLKWCLFINPMHAYSGEPFEIEAVLANESVLAPGDYPARFKISGPTGTIWKHETVIHIGEADLGNDGRLAFTVFKEEVILNGPAGHYEFVANIESGCAPNGGRLKFHISDSKALPKVDSPVVLWGVEKRIEEWLISRGVKCIPFAEASTEQRQVVLVGDGNEALGDGQNWMQLAKMMAQGSSVIFAEPDCFRKPVGTKLGALEMTGNLAYSFRDFPVANVPADEAASFTAEFYGNFSFVLSNLPEQNYRIELGMCEGCFDVSGWRKFNIRINGKLECEKFDILKEAGGPKLAVMREFNARPEDGNITVLIEAAPDWGSVSRIRVFDENDKMVVDVDARHYHDSQGAWLPLETKGQCYTFDDWLYHKECVAKLHPVFDGLQCKGIMDWDYYDQIMPKRLFKGQQTPDDVAVAGFALGHSVPGGYDCGAILCSYPFAAGRFVLNTLRVFEHVGTHPAADRLLINMINYAADRAKGSIEALPADFESMLKSIGYE